MRMGKRERLAARNDKHNRAIMHDKASQGRDGFKSATPLYHAHVNLGGHGVRGPREGSLEGNGRLKPVIQSKPSKKAEPADINGFMRVQEARLQKAIQWNTGAENAVNK